MKIKQIHIFVLSALSLAVLVGCRQEPLPQPPAAKESRPGKVHLTIGGTSLWAEVAGDEAARSQGLMHRRQMPQDEGMLFVFEYPQQLSFWMKNTYLPLDIAFVSKDGTILNILRMEPLNEVPRYLSRGPALYAIEANAGWFKDHGIKAGDRVRF